MQILQSARGACGPFGERLKRAILATRIERSGSIVLADNKRFYRLRPKSIHYLRGECYLRAHR